ncbi:MAG: hypothetical protein V4596_03640 [Bdellovibrionota bacterium]
MKLLVDDNQILRQSIKFLCILFAQFFILGNYSNAWALPDVDPKYANEYAKVREDLSLPATEMVQDAYNNKNPYLAKFILDRPAEMEFILASGISPYRFSSPEKSKADLEELITRTQSSSDKTELQQKELILGDAYHWLGHVYNDRREYAKAYECFVRSHVHYQKTSLQYSPRINPQIIVQEHAWFHLKQSMDIFRQLVSKPEFHGKVCASLF